MERAMFYSSVEDLSRQWEEAEVREDVLDSLRQQVQWEDRAAIAQMANNWLLHLICVLAQSSRGTIVPFGKLNGQAQTEALWAIA